MGGKLEIKGIQGGGIHRAMIPGPAIGPKVQIGAKHTITDAQYSICTDTGAFFLCLYRSPPQRLG
jgi:hypothetical protein